MTEGFDYDPFEYAELIRQGEDLGRSDLSEPIRSDDEPRGLTRRDLLVKGGVGAAAVAGMGALAGTAAAKPASSGKFTGTLRVLTLGVEFPIPDLAKQASKDLGFTVKPIIAASQDQPKIAITSPDTFDVFGGYNYQTLLVWPSGGLQPLDTHKIPSWNQFYKLFTYGKLNPSSATCTYGQGNAPFRTTFVDPNGSTGLPPYSQGPASNKQVVRWIGENGKPIGGKPQPRFIVGPAAHFNADSMGYNADVVQKAPNKVSWAELLNTKWKGRVSLLRDPGIMTQDAAAAVGALGLLKIKDYGNPTKAEIDRLFKILGRYKKNGQFRAFWSQFTDSVNFMASKEVVIESMWSPAVALLKAQGVDVL
jgi:putative spermidine/putrescine transport system substrate-binding protein